MAKKDGKKEVIDADFKPIQIIFEMKDITKASKCSKWIFYHAKAELSTTENELVENKMVFHYKTKKIELFEIPREYENVKEEYREFVSKILITDTFLKESINLNDCPELLPGDIIKLINAMTKEIENSLLEIIITNSVLGSLDGKEREKILTDLDIKDDFSVLKRLFGTSRRLSHSEITKILNLIKTEDYFLLKTVFYFIHEKIGIKELKATLKRYYNLKGKPAFTEEEETELRDNFTRSHIILELFFRNYIHLNKVLEQVHNYDEDSESYTRIAIPLNPIAYSIKKICGECVADFIKKSFDEEPLKILECFKRVLRYETKRLKGFELNNTIISFDYSGDSEYIDDLRKSEIYYDSITNLIIFKKRKSDPILEKYSEKEDYDDKGFSHFCIFKGSYQDIKVSKITWDKVFRGVDIYDMPIECRITENKGYYKDLELGMETSIEIQSILHIKYWFNKKVGVWEYREGFFLEVLDMKIIKGFKPLKIKMGSDHIGDIYLENTRKGLTQYKYTRKDSIYKKNILAYPLELIHVYEGENDYFYECRINSEIVCKTKADLFKYLEDETTYAFISGKDLKDAINNVLRKSQEESEFPVLKMYHTAGVFLDREDQDFIIVHPFKEDLYVFGENDVQFRYIERIKEKGIDLEGKLTRCFYDLLHIKTMREDVRIGAFGYSAIHPFFYALSGVIDVFPNLFMISGHGSGKTTLLEILINHLYGTEMKSPDSIESTARLTKYSTESPFGLNIDDIDFLDPKLMNWIKTNSTRKGTRDRMDKEQKMNREQTYAPYTGSANIKDFLTGESNNAFRKRCLIFEGMERIELKADTMDFDILSTEIAEGKIYGFYLLEKAMEFFEKLSDKPISSYFKLVRYLNDLKKRLKQLFINKEVFISDIRRLTIYTLFYIGLQIWSYVFRENKLESPILTKILNLEREEFIDIVKKLEETERDITLTVFDTILYFFESNIGRFDKKRTPKENEIVLTLDFIEKYDEFARKRGYDILGNLVKLGDLQSQILNREIKPDGIYFKIDGGNWGGTKHGIIFYYEEIAKLRHKIIVNVLEEKPGTVEKIELDEIFIGSKKIEEEDAIVKRIEEIFASNKFKALEEKALRQILVLDFSKELIERAFDYLWDNEIIYPDVNNDNLIYFKKG